MARTDVRASAIIIKDNKILLIHRRKPGEEYWVFPGGGVEDTETTKEAVIREVKEETNLDVLTCNLAFMAFNEASKKEEPFFECEVNEGTPEIVGEEKGRNTLNNWYNLEWISINDITTINLVPLEAARHVIEKYQS